MTGKAVGLGSGPDLTPVKEAWGWGPNNGQDMAGSRPQALIP
jgi:hypothetical protein